MNVVPAAGERSADRDDPPVYIDEQLEVDPVLAVLAGQQVLSMAPVERRHEGTVDQEDPACEQGRKVIVAGGQGVGQEGDHRLVVVPCGGGADREVLVQVDVCRVPAWPAQRQAKGFDRKYSVLAWSR